tara:strand:- start:1698 stop:2483 length:786 start_codon:yes stop_codon:yes gene_type:complete
MIRVEELDVIVNKNTRLLSNIDFSLDYSEIVSIVGKNGAGKSTLLRAICGDLRTAKGVVKYDNTSIRNIDLQSLSRIRAVVSQSIQLQFSFTVAEVVAFGRSPFNNFYNKNSDIKVVHECLREVDAYNLRYRDYTTLSGGEKQRVQFARALAQVWDAIQSQEGCYLFLDEPLSNLDISHQHDIMNILSKIVKKNVGIFIILHDLNLAAQYSDRIIILKDGEVFRSGSTEEIFKDSIISSAFDFQVKILVHPNNDCPLVVPG